MKEELARRADRLALMPLRRGRTVRLEELSRWEGTLVACKKKLDVPALRRYDVIEQAFREIDIAYHQRKTKILMRYGPYQGRPRAEAIGREAAELAEPGQLLKDLEEYIRVYQKKRTLELDELYLVGDYAKISILKQLARWAELLLYIRGEQWGPDQETDPFCLAAAEQARAREVEAACDVALDGQAGQYEKELEAAMTAAVEALGRLSQWSGQLGLSKTGHALEQDETFAASSRETREMLIRQLEAFAFRHAIDPVRCAKALVQAAEERGGEVFSVFEDRELIREIFGIRQRGGLDSGVSPGFADCIGHPGHFGRGTVWPGHSHENPAGSAGLCPNTGAAGDLWRPWAPLHRPGQISPGAAPRPLEGHPAHAGGRLHPHGADDFAP